MTRTPRSFRVEAVVLKHSEYGEADRILTLYTRERGKVRAIAKGVRKLRSRKAGHVEPFTRVSLQLATGRNLFVVSQAEAVDVYTDLRDDLVKVGYASYIVELLDKFTFDEEENTSVYRILINTLKRLSQEYAPELVVRFYEVRLLDALGFRPELQTCVVSEEQIKAEDQYFSAALGGVISPEHGRGMQGAVPVSMDALRYLRHFQRSDWQAAARANMSDETKNELEVLMQHYLTYLLERALNTPAFLRRVRREEK
ncbi:MAG: DNA repair protein RecO [Chloroflexi bacterium]|nr:MAG: DNA repair protein RecO [Chloroflexota bacterium]MBL1194387.1 DNA repair protein RecO [Chloroflexota bacterium]NOH11675.1 DNA repair protein RecO [Chloroflexota bacterium]